MQMRKTYHTTNKKRRAAQYRQAADECANAGFMDLAGINWQMSFILDPPHEEEIYRNE